MAALKHPHVVSFYHSFFDPGEKHLCIILVRTSFLPLLVFLPRQVDVCEKLKWVWAAFLGVGVGAV